MRTAYLLPVSVLGLLVLQGCAASTHYAWGKYDESLYSHYKAPQEREAFVANLKEVVLQSEQEGKLVPPGIYAEYGYALLEEGQNQAAVSYFKKEQAKWPESNVLMEKMIRVADRRSAQIKPQDPTIGPAGELERTKTP